MRVAGRCWACSLGCFWWCLIADVVEKRRGGRCLGCCWECRWWCLIEEWGWEVSRRVLGRCIVEGEGVAGDISLRRGSVVGGGWLCVWPEGVAEGVVQGVAGGA